MLNKADLNVFSLWYHSEYYIKIIIGILNYNVTVSIIIIIVIYIQTAHGFYSICHH